MCVRNDRDALYERLLSIGVCTDLADTVSDELLFRLRCLYSVPAERLRGIPLAVCFAPLTHCADK